MEVRYQLRHSPVRLGPFTLPENHNLAAARDDPFALIRGTARVSVDKGTKITAGEGRRNRDHGATAAVTG
jgi:hypothetical protein